MKVHDSSAELKLGAMYLAQLIAVGLIVIVLRFGSGKNVSNIQSR